VIAETMMKTLITIAMSAVALANAQVQSSGKESAVTHHARGTFDVKIGPLAAYSQEDKTLGRFSIDKQFYGDLVGTSKGEMLSAGSSAGSGGYVAIEKITGTLNAHSGSFVLQHNATMDNGKPHLNIIVVPGSGSGELTGITGKMEIIIDKGKHSYVFEYTL